VKLACRVLRFPPSLSRYERKSSSFKIRNAFTEASAIIRAKKLQLTLVANSGYLTYRPNSTSWEEAAPVRKAAACNCHPLRNRANTFDIGTSALSPWREVFIKASISRSVEGNPRAQHLKKRIKGRRRREKTGLPYKVRHIPPSLTYCYACEQREGVP
jgi:hypothetical protein